MVLDRPRPGTERHAEDRSTSARIQWVSRTAAPPDLMRSAYARLQAGELKSNRIEMRVLRKCSALATALRHRKAMFVPEDDPTRYTARSSGDAATERAVMELAVEGELAPRPFAVTADHLAALVNAMPVWQPSVSLNTLVDDDDEVEGLMVWAGERYNSAVAYGVARTLPRPI